jgi:hypothetical protein
MHFGDGDRMHPHASGIGHGHVSVRAAYSASEGAKKTRRVCRNATSRFVSRLLATQAHSCLLLLLLLAASSSPPTPFWADKCEPGQTDARLNETEKLNDSFFFFFFERSHEDDRH